eukprot:6728112-Prymnesium_polylepis.1
MLKGTLRAGTTLIAGVVPSTYCGMAFWKVAPGALGGAGGGVGGEGGEQRVPQSSQSLPKAQ